MALLDDVGNFAKTFGFLVGHYSDPAVRATPGGFQMAVWQTYYDAVQSWAVPPPTISLQTMGHYVSAAAAVARSSMTLQNAIRQVGLTGIDQAITANMVAADIDARSVDQQPLGPNLRVRFQADITLGGIPTSQWFTWESGLQGPQTVQQLLDAIDAAGQAFGQQYNVTYEGLGAAVQITTW